ncbi:MAG TPA: putative sporulation protein YtxC [Candidatus Deferrimicrobium sp.]|nr:putative sporulation protein YtxC [Candidatus Deferrimicrobium sp.]
MNICIGARKYIDGVRDTLNSQVAILADIKVDLAEKKVGDFTFIDLTPVEHIGQKVGEGVFKHYIANALAETILQHWEAELINRELKVNHQQFTEQERTTILAKANKVLNEGISLTTPIYRTSRKTKIIQQLLDYLEINNKVILEGFIRFRLKEYYSELQTAITLAVDEFLMEKEYSEFIKLLKYFVDIQEPKLETLNVLVKTSGSFQLYDCHHELVNNDYLEGFVADLIDNEITYEDLLISALITIAPRFVVLHGLSNKKDNETINTIRNVFGERISSCQGCSLCNLASRS